MSQASGRDPFNLGFGIAAVLFALTALFVWFPNDMRGGFTELSPGGDTAPGDAFFPTLLAVAILILGVVQTAAALRAKTASTGRLTRFNLSFVAAFVVLFAVGITLFTHTGQLAAEWLGPAPYRQLSDTAPWKWIGFCVGGFLIGYGPVLAVERRFRFTSALVVVAALVVLIVIFDGLLADIRLPPNADV